MQEGCPICAAELGKFERTVSAIGFAAEEAETPEYVRDLVLARAEREPQPRASQNRDAEATPVAQPAAPPDKRSRSLPWIVAAAFGALGALLLTAYMLKSALETNTQLQAKISTAQADTDRLRALLSAQQGEAGKLEQILSIIGKPGGRVARLVGQPAPPSSSGAILWDTERNHCLLFGVFPPPPQGKAYQLWFVTPTVKVPAGLVRCDPDGRTFTTMRAPSSAMDATGVAVTLEPDNGSEIPTMPFCAVGRFN
jgi:hypothetical protein